MKIVIIGAVAAGTSAAAKARRNDETAEIKIYEMDSEISYSGCGLPYYIGTGVESRDLLVPRDAKFFKKKYNVDIYTRHQVLEVIPDSKRISVKKLDTGETFEDYYDILVIATGARPVKPAIEGIEKENVFYLRNVPSADRIREFVDKGAKSAVIIGSGFIGLELAENLKVRNVDVTIVEMADQVMPMLDKDVSVYLEEYLKEKGINLILKDAVTGIEGDAFVSKLVLESGKIVRADFVVVATGVRPNVELAVKAGIELGHTGAIKVNSRMQTNLDSVYACGDCAESYSLITGKPLYRPLGSTANKMGRIAGDCITGGSLEFRGILGTGIFKFFDMAVAQTGMSEEDARKEGLEVVVCHNIKPDKPEYFKGKEITIKAVADRKTGRILGAQIIGMAGVDKRIDVFVAAITFGAKAEDLFHLDLAYAPPFSTTKDPVMYTGMILDSAINRGRELMTADELEARMDAGEHVEIIDARAVKQYEESHIDGAISIPHEKIRKDTAGLDKDKLTVTYCNKGVTGNAAQNILINNGFKKVYNLSGGHKNFMKTRKG